jgi:hypothetical protein
MQCKEVDAFATVDECRSDSSTDDVALDDWIVELIVHAELADVAGTPSLERSRASKSAEAFAGIA